MVRGARYLKYVKEWNKSLNADNIKTWLKIAF